MLDQSDSRLSRATIRRGHGAFNTVVPLRAHQSERHGRAGPRTWMSAARHTLPAEGVPSLAKLCAGRPQPARINHGNNTAL